MAPGHDARAYELLVAFIQSFGHHVRTPLSVISNELFYLDSLVAEKETRLAKENCRRISTLLTEAAGPETGPLRMQTHDLCALLRTIFESKFDEVTSPTRAMAKLDCSRFSHACRLIAQLLETSSATRVSIRESEGKLNSSNGLAIHFQARMAFEKGTKEVFDSFLGYRGRYGSQDAWVAVQIDAIVWAHGGQSQIVCDEESQLCIQVRVPSA